MPPKKSALPVQKSKPLSITKKQPKDKEMVQTKPTPDERDPARRFYTSLLKQNKNSKMAKKWCIERGL